MVRVSLVPMITKTIFVSKICMIMVFTSQLQNENTFFASFFINILLNWIGLKLTECIISSIYNVGKYKICMVSL